MRKFLKTTNLDFPSLSITEGEYYPHWTCDDAIYHVVFRLFDSISKVRLEIWKKQKNEIEQSRQKRRLSFDEIGKLELFKKLDDLMLKKEGSLLLSNNSVAQMLVNLMKEHHGERYNLHAYCVMPNHVHVIIEPLNYYELEQIIVFWKRYSSHTINKILNRTGPVWAKDYFDHIIRSPESYDYQVKYVKNNPIAAGLLDWPWVGEMPIL